jgi:hypothetical protein
MGVALLEVDMSKQVELIELARECEVSEGRS